MGRRSRRQLSRVSFLFSIDIVFSSARGLYERVQLAFRGGGGGGGGALIILTACH